MWNHLERFLYLCNSFDHDQFHDPGQMEGPRFGSVFQNVDLLEGGDPL